MAVRLKGVNLQPFVVELIVDAEEKQFRVIEGKPETSTGILKSVIKPPPDPVIGIGIRNLVKVAADNHRVRTLAYVPVHQGGLPAVGS